MHGTKASIRNNTKARAARASVTKTLARTTLTGCGMRDVIGFDQPPKSSSMMFSSSTPRSFSILMTEAFMMGGPHI